MGGGMHARMDRWLAGYLGTKGWKIIPHGSLHLKERKKQIEKCVILKCKQC